MAEGCKNCGHECHCDKECPDCVNDVCVNCEHDKEPIN